MERLLLVAAGGLAREVISALECGSPGAVTGLLDDDPELRGRIVGGVPVLGPIDQVSEYPETSLVICAGRGAARLAIADRLAGLGIDDARYATVVDPSVRVPRSCHIGVGSVLLANTVLTADVTVGRHVVVMPNATLTHDNEVSDFATICAGVVLGGHVRIGSAAYLGMGAAVRERLSVGAHAVLGMGSVLLRDVPAGQTWAGVPARSLEAAS